jgi:hypothetical protein
LDMLPLKTLASETEDEEEPSSPQVRVGSAWQCLRVRACVRACLRAVSFRVGPVLLF